MDYLWSRDEVISSLEQMKVNYDKGVESLKNSDPISDRIQRDITYYQGIIAGVKVALGFLTTLDNSK